MQILTSLNGIFPRSQSLIEATRKFEQRKITSLQLEEVFNKDYKNLERIARKLDLVSDGLLCWQDLIRPFASVVQNAEVDGLVRYFETNCFYRKILFPSKVKLNFDDFYRKYFRFGNTAFLPSLITFKFFSNADYDKIIYILKETVKFLSFKKYKYIILQEPAILFNFESSMKKQVERLVNTIRKECSDIVVIINTFFKKIEKTTLQFLLSQDIDGIGIDFTNNSIEYIRKNKWGKDKGIFANVINTTSTKVEKVEQIKQFVITLHKVISPKFIIVSGAPDFEFIPYDYAIKKVDILIKIKNEFEQESKIQKMGVVAKEKE